VGGTRTRDASDGFLRYKSFEQRVITGVRSRSIGPLTNGLQLFSVHFSFKHESFNESVLLSPSFINFSFDVPFYNPISTNFRTANLLVKLPHRDYLFAISFSAFSLVVIHSVRFILHGFSITHLFSFLFCR